MKQIILNKKWVAEKLPKRPKDANKGTFGKVLVVAGSENYPGAAYLSCAACYRVGAGLVTLATIPSVKIIVSRKLPEVTFLKRSEIPGKIKDYDVLLVGPGLEQDYRLPLTNFPPAVIDAGGLKWGIRLKGEVILTPHPGEMSELTGLSIDEIQKDRVNIVKKFAMEWRKVVVLKGANTVIASPDGKIKINSSVNPLLATAGTGDVLAGIIAGLLAQGLKLADAASIGVYIHGLAGEKLRKKIGNTGALASDLLPLLPQVIGKLNI